VRPGGLGLHFIRCGADEVSYDLSRARGTSLRLVKRKRSAGPCR
jgi:anti-sigma regulatory factor (Ser/Thr protein kinase)